MMNETDYTSVRVMDTNGKVIKCSLNLYINKYELNGITRMINWEKAKYIRSTETIKSFLFKSQKPVIVIYQDDNYGPKIILNNSVSADALIAKITELAEIAKQNRLEEEERQRKEEEERKRKEKERKRREAEERKRKKEEERKRKEALAKKISDRKQRLIDEVEEAKTGATEISLSTVTDLAIKKAWSYIIDNPYSILGISAAATNEEANASLDHFKEFAPLNAAEAFETEYHLNGMEKPEREIRTLQNALAAIKDNKYKWLWFTDAGACTAWQSEKYRKELNYDGPEYGTYDLFLANYMFALFFDPTFKESILWKPIFTYFAFICKERGHAMLKSRFNGKALKGIKVQELVRDFKEEIFVPVEDLCETDDVNRILRLFEILKEISDTNIDELKKKVTLRITEWFIVKQETVFKAFMENDEDDTITETEAEEIKRIGDAYINEVESVLESAMCAVRDEPQKYELIKESYRRAIWNLMFSMQKAGEKNEAIYYANKCYRYCEKEDKRRIRSTFGCVAIEGSEQDTTEDEWDVMGYNYYEGKDGYEQNYFKAFKWYKKAAEAGNKHAMNSLGICYVKGNGTDKNEHEAAKWFEKAYQAGSADGAVNLANCYISGNGKPEDKYKGLELLSEAVKMGHPTAAERENSLRRLLEIQEKIHRKTQHKHYELGYLDPDEDLTLVEVELNQPANVYLMETEAYENYCKCEDFKHYGGRRTETSFFLLIPHTGCWHLVIDNGADDITGISASVRLRIKYFYNHPELFI